jgi:hypothetical protein
MSEETPNPQGTDTVISIGCRIDCPYFSKEDGDSGSVELWCSRFQIVPECQGDINNCDVLMFAPDPRDGYR